MFFFKNKLLYSTSPKFGWSFLPKKVLSTFSFLKPLGFCGNHGHFLKAALEDSHPVVRQNAAGALARKLNSSSNVWCFEHFAGWGTQKHNQAVTVWWNADYDFNQATSQTSRGTGLEPTPALCHPFCSFQLWPSACLKTGQQGCQSHDRSKAMAEAIDSAHMLGLGSTLQRRLGDDFNMLWTICWLSFGIFWCFHLTELIEYVLHTLMKMIQLTEICE